MKGVSVYSLVRKVMRPIAAVALVYAASSCYNIGNPNGIGPGGSVFSSARVGMTASDRPILSVGYKEAEGCAYRFLSLAAFGGATTFDVAKQAGISEIQSVHYKTFGILGLFNSMCTVVRGN